MHVLYGKLCVQIVWQQASVFLPVIQSSDYLFFLQVLSFSLHEQVTCTEFLLHCMFAIFPNLTCSGNPGYEGKKRVKNHLVAQFLFPCLGLQ